MNRNKELAKNTAIIAVGKICTQFITFFLLPIYTHFLTTSEYGTIDMIVTATSLIAPILSLQMERAIFRYLIDARNDKNKQDRILSTAITSIIPSIILVTSAIPIASIFFNLKHAPLIGLMIITSILSNVALQIPRGLGNNIHFSIGSIIIGTTNALISIVATVFLHMGVMGVLIANIISHIAGVLYIFAGMRLYKKVHFTNSSRKTLKELLAFSIPMIPNDISYWVINISDRMLIFFFLGDSFNGIYATSTKFPALIITIYNIFNLSWMETVSAHVNDSDAKQYLSKTYNTIIKLFASICLCATALMPFVFSWIIGEDFKESYIYIATLICGAFFNIIVGMLGSVYIGYKKTKTMAKTTMLAAAINLIVNFVLIKQIGIWAAVYSTLAAYAIVSILRLTSIQKTVKIETDWKTFILFIILFTINIMLYSMNTTVANIANLTIMLVVSIFMNRNVLKGTFKQVRKAAKRITH